MNSKIGKKSFLRDENWGSTVYHVSFLSVNVYHPVAVIR